MIHKRESAILLKMGNAFLVKILLVVFFMTIFSNVNYISASSSYNDNQVLKIGLTSMVLNTITVKVNGNYLVNSKLYNSGTSFVISNISGKITLNGIVVTSLSFISQTVGNYISITSVGGTSQKYLGDMSFTIDSSSLKILPVNSVKLEDYLKGVVPYEVSESYPIEALKAQAVSARSYALANIGNFAAYGYDLTDDVSSQVYFGYSIINAKCDQAVDITKGQILTYNGQVISTYYSASDGGYTEDSKNVWSTCLPYFKSQIDSFDTNTTWTKSFTSAQIQNILINSKKILLTDKVDGINLNTITTYASGRIFNITINYEDIIKTPKYLYFTKESARTFLFLQSSLYKVTYDKSTDMYTFNGKGNGHGVGMSQIGALNRAKDGGQTYNQILSFYYDSSVLTNLVVIPQIGWILKNGKWYYTEASGIMATNKWEQDSSKLWYYMGSSGAMVTNSWAQDSSKKWYYLGSSGVMVTNSWKQNSLKKWYFLGLSGVMTINNWVVYNGKKYYLSADGSMVTGSIQIGGKWYSFDNSGGMLYYNNY